MKLVKFLKPEFVVAFAAVVILTYVLMFRPIIGVADNGDFPRIMNSVGLSYIPTSYEDRYFGYVNREYKVGISVPFGGGYFSTELIPVTAAILLGRSLNAQGNFDIRYLGFIYSLVFIAAIALIVACVRKKWGAAGWIAAVLAVFIFMDTGYTAYFNSFYGEAVTLVFLLLTLGTGLYLAFSVKPRLWVLLLFFTGAAFFAGAKVQNAPAGILAILLGFRFIRLRHDALWRRTVVASMVVVVAVSILSYALVSREIKICNKYQTVFYGILKDSPDPSADLEELGLDTKLSVLAGTNYFMDQYPVDIRTVEFKKNIDANVNHLKIAMFYMRHPERLIGKLEVAANNGFKLVQGFGNYEKYPGITYKKTAKIFTIWSDFKLKLLPHSLLFLILFYGTCGFIIVMEYLRQRETGNYIVLELSALVWLTGIMQFVMPIIGDGEADLSKHLFMFNVCFDLMFFALTTYCLSRLAIVLKSVFSLVAKPSTT